jgi:hypothetical protein
VGLRMRRSSTRRLAALTTRLDTAALMAIVLDLFIGGCHDHCGRARRPAQSQHRGRFAPRRGASIARDGLSGETRMPGSADPSITTIVEE